MTEEPITKALERMEQALARTETAAGRVGALADRHTRLKASVSRSLKELDSFLEEALK